MNKVGRTGSSYIAFQLKCDGSDCGHHVFGHSEAHVKDKLKNHKKTKKCKGYEK